MNNLIFDILFFISYFAFIVLSILVIIHLERSDKK